MPDYEKLFAECVAEMDRPLPKACLSTGACRIAGGCPECYADLIRSHEGPPEIRAATR